MAGNRPNRVVGVLVMAILVVVLVVLRLYPQGARDVAPGASAPTPVEATTSADAAPHGFGPNVGFRSAERLREHFEKHGAEFRGADEGEYLAIAQALRDARVGGDVLESVRGDGVVSRFDRATGTFVAFDADGVLRTCFKPNDGERYFERQAKRRPR